MTSTIKTLSLKAARVEYGYTQKEIANRLGVTRESYNAWETGKTVPRHMVIYSLAYIYGIDSDVLRLPKKF